MRKNLYQNNLSNKKWKSYRKSSVISHIQDNPQSQWTYYQSVRLSAINKMPKFKLQKDSDVYQEEMFLVSELGDVKLGKNKM